jgi:ketosteroid isomerase-like protein
MKLSRRTLGLVSVGVAVGLAKGQSASAQSMDEKALANVIEDLRLGIINKVRAKLEAATAENLSYGHSTARVETKKQFVDFVMARKAVIKRLDFTEPRNDIHGQTAIARHFYDYTTEEDGKEASFKVGVLQVWQKENGNWKLYARQAYSLPPLKT